MTVEPKLRDPTRWLDARYAPMGERIRVEVQDAAGVYKLPFLVIRRRRGFIHAETGKLIELNIVRFKRNG